MDSIKDADCVYALHKCLGKLKTVKLDTKYLIKWQHITMINTGRTLNHLLVSSLFDSRKKPSNHWVIDTDQHPPQIYKSFCAIVKFLKILIIITFKAIFLDSVSEMWIKACLAFQCWCTKSHKLQCPLLSSALFLQCTFRMTHIGMNKQEVDYYY